MSESDTKNVLSYLQEEKLVTCIQAYHAPIPTAVPYRPRLKNHRPELPVPENFRHLYEPRPKRTLPKRVPMPDPKIEVKLTHKGRKEVEQSVMTPEKSTEQSSPSITQLFNAPVGAVQNAAHSNANVNQNIGATMPEVLDLIQELRHTLLSLPAESQKATTRMVDVIEAEVQSNEPDFSRIKSLVNGVKALAGAASTGVAVVSAVEKVANLAEKIINLLP